MGSRAQRPTNTLAARVSPPTEVRPTRDVFDRARAGDRAAQDALYRQHARWVWRAVIVPILRDPASAEDVLCEAFLAAFRALPEWTPTEGRAPDEAFASWLAQIARRKALDELRKQARGVRLLERASHHARDAETPPLLEEIVAHLEADHARRVQVESVLESLHARYAEAIHARLLEGCSREEAAARLGVRVPTFDVTLHRALRAFRAAYEERYGAPQELP